MYEHPFEIGVDIRNCYDDEDLGRFMEAYNSKDPKTPEEHADAIRFAFRECASLPSSFSFHAIASVNAIDKDREKVTVDSIKRHMDTYIRYGGNINWEHRDLVTGKVWDWAPVSIKGRPGVQIWGNLYGGRDIYDKVRKSFVDGRNGFSLGGQAPATGYKCDEDGCYIQREVSSLYEISVTANPANPYARTLDYNRGALAKGGAQGVDLTIEEYTIHRDYTTCPIMRVKHDLEAQGLAGCHATSDGVTVPIHATDWVYKRFVGEQGYVVSETRDGEMLFQDRAWATERAFKDLYERGLVDADGVLSDALTKSEFEDLYTKGLIELDDDGTARVDMTVIY